MLSRCPHHASIKIIPTGPVLVPSSFSCKLSLSFFLSMDRVTPHMYHVIPVPLLLLGHHPCPPQPP
ncbi:unnamed protein product [Musa textilis]